MKMKKSYIAGVAKLLGVEEGEVFQVNDDGTLEKCFFKFTDGFLYISDNGKDDSWCVAKFTTEIQVTEFTFLSLKKEIEQKHAAEFKYDALNNKPSIEITDNEDLPY